MNAQFYPISYHYNEWVVSPKRARNDGEKIIKRKSLANIARLVCYTLINNVNDYAAKRRALNFDFNLYSAW